MRIYKMIKKYLYIYLLSANLGMKLHYRSLTETSYLQFFFNVFLKSITVSENERMEAGVYM